MPETLKIGIVGLDTSHVVAFTQLLNDPSHAYHVPGGRVVAAFPGGSPDFALSRDRVGKFTSDLREKYRVEILDAPEAVAERCDGILLTSVDGRVHRAQFEKIAPFGKPTFIDKPFATSSADARAIADLARRHNVPILSTSSLRYAESLVSVLNEAKEGEIIGADAYGPMSLEPTQPGLFWYGIHAVDMLYAALGPGCRHVTARTTDDHELVTGVWADGRVGVVRGNRKGNNTFGALVHRAKGTQWADVRAHPKPTYAGLLDRILPMMITGKSPLDIAETVEVIRFIEAANDSRKGGRKVAL